MILSAHKIAVHFGLDVALSSVSVSLAEDERVAIVGPSGSGKSTLLACLAGIRAPESGSVRFRDQQLSQLTEPRRRRLRAKHFGFVMQFGELVPQLTLLENVLLGGMVRGDRSLKRDASALLEAVGIDQLADRLPSQVSGGERQRAAVARALMGRPEVVFADEPTGALDSTARDLVMDLLFDHTREAGTALVVVTHDERTLDRFDTVHRMRDGELVDDAQIVDGSEVVEGPELVEKLRSDRG